MLLVELREAEIWLRRVSRGEVEEVDVEEEVESESVWALRSCWTLAMAVLESSTLPEARSLRRAARSLVSLAVAVLVGSAAVAEAVLEVLVVEDVLLVCPVRSSCSIKAREEEERAEMDMRDPFRAVEITSVGNVGRRAENFSGIVEETEFGTFFDPGARVASYDGRVELLWFSLAVLLTICPGSMDCGRSELSSLDSPSMAGEWKFTSGSAGVG